MNVAVILAAGCGKRFVAKGVDLPKQYFVVNKKYILRHSIDVCLQHSGLDKVLVAIHPEHTHLYKEAIQDIALHDKLLPFVYGGKERYDSVRIALQSLAKYDIQYVLLHDAARPNLSIQLLDELLTLLRKGKKCVVPVTKIPHTILFLNTIQEVSKHNVNRNRVVAVHTPQAFVFKEILHCHEREQMQDMPYLCTDLSQQTMSCTDDSLLFKKYNKSQDIALLYIDHFYKITTYGDLLTMKG